MLTMKKKLTQLVIVYNKMTFVYKKNSNNDFVCPDCPFTAHNQSTMHYHLRNHTGVLEHECPDCDMKFLQKGVLDLHIKSKHNKVTKKEFTCPCCTYTDLRKGNCLIHFARIHLKELTDKMKLKTHDGTECSECEKHFKNITSFYYHLGTCVKLPSNHTHYEMWSKIH